MITRTWFHTGAYDAGDRMLHRLRDEHSPETAAHARGCCRPARALRDREARALKGVVLRQEVQRRRQRAGVPYRVVETTDTSPGLHRGRDSAMRCSSSTAA